jgi:hypothetical protein
LLSDASLQRSVSVENEMSEFMRRIEPARLGGLHGVQKYERRDGFPVREGVEFNARFREREDPAPRDSSRWIMS